MCVCVCVRVCVRVNSRLPPFERYYDPVLAGGNPLSDPDDLLKVVYIFTRPQLSVMSDPEQYR